MKEIENNLKSKRQETIREIGGLSLIFPTTFYMQTCNEVSSNGYENLLLFYEYTIEQWENFVRWWIDRVYNHDPDEMVPYIKGEEDIFRARTRIPRYFLLGLAITLLYSLVLIMVGYFRFRKEYFPTNNEPGAYSRLAIGFKTGKSYTVRACRKEFNPQLLKVLFGKGGGYKFDITVDGKKLSGEDRQDILYITGSGEFPGDLTGGQLVNLFRKQFKPGKELLEEVVGLLEERNLLKKDFSGLELAKRTYILLVTARLSKRLIIVLRDFLYGCSLDSRYELRELAAGLKTDKVMILELAFKDAAMLEAEINYNITYDEGYYKMNSSTDD